MALGKLKWRAVYLLPRYSRTTGALAILVALTIAAIFLLPSIQGPYSAVNGPATAFRAAQSAVKAHASIVQAATHFAPNPWSPPMRPIVQGTLEKTESRVLCAGVHSVILRC
jgi:hypothetical protein